MLLTNSNPLPRCSGLSSTPGVAELAPSAGLLLVSALGLSRASNRLLIRYPRGIELDLHSKLPLHLLIRDFQVKVAHSRENHFLGLGIPGQREGRVFLHEPLDGSAHLLFVPF